MTIWYNKQGKPIDLVKANTLLGDMKYKVVEQTILDNKKFVSTVWLGLDMGWGMGKPMIFETMVFLKKGNWEDLDCVRYPTIAEAKKGHKLMVKKWNKK